MGPVPDVRNTNGVGVVKVRERARVKARVRAKALQVSLKMNKEQFKSLRNNSQTPELAQHQLLLARHQMQLVQLQTHLKTVVLYLHRQ